MTAAVLAAHEITGRNLPALPGRKAKGFYAKGVPRQERESVMASCGGGRLGTARHAGSMESESLFFEN